MTCERRWSLGWAVVLAWVMVGRPVEAQPLSPVVEAGGSGTVFFGSVRGIGVDASGERVYVLDHIGSEVIVLDPAGRDVDRWGREGDGPGEFAEPLSAVRVRGDEVFVATVGGIQLFRPDGSFVRRLPLSVETPVWALVGLEVTDSSVVAVLRVSGSGEQWVEVHAVGDDGSTLIAETPWVSPRAAAGERPAWAGAGPILLRSRGGTDTVEVLDASGERVSEWRVPGGGVPLSRDVVAERVDALVALCEGTGPLEARCRDGLAPMIADVRALEGRAAPPIGGMVGSAGGRALVLRVDRGDHPFESVGRSFQILEDGDLLYEGEFDRPVTPMAFDGTTVWARFLGPYDEPLVVAYRLPM